MTSRRPVAALLVPLATAALVVTALSGCAPAQPSASKPHTGPGIAQPHPVATPTATSTSTSAPVASFPPALPAGALLQVSATVTAPGGAAADLVQTVWLPAAATAAQKTQLDTDCAGESDPDAAGAPWLNDYQGADMLTATVTATLLPGSPAWDNNTNGVLSEFMGFGDFTGAYNSYEALCAPGFIQIPGTQNQLAPIQGTNPSGQNYGWAGEFASFGFYGGGNDPGASDLGGSALVSHCVVQLSSTAKAAGPTVLGWATHTYSVEDGCSISGPQV